MRQLSPLALLLPLTALAQAPVIEISGANFRPMPIAVPAPIARDGVSQSALSEFDQTFVFDLSAAGLFQLLDRRSFLADSAAEGLTPGSIRFERWSDVGAESLIKTTLAPSGGQVSAELHLFTVATGKEELKLTESASASELRRLAHGLADALYRHFTRETGPFGTHLVFTRKTGAGKEVCYSDWDGQNLRTIASGGINALPALAPDGQAVAFTSYRNGKPDLYVQRAGAPTAVPLVQAGRMATGVAYSPDGKRIAYSLSEGEGAQLFVAAADGTSPRQLTRTPYFLNTSPTWSPDGARLAFVSNRGGSPQIYVVSAQGGEARRLTFKGTYNQTPDWSPRGDLIAFTARDERNAFDLFTTSIETGRVVRLTQAQGNNEEPSFSPNGRLITFVSTRSGTPSLYVMTFDGQNQLALPVAKGSYATPDWGP